MSATADADLFANYFSQAGPEALLTGQSTNGGTGQQPRGLSVGLLSIPGFTHPVRQLWLEDALQATGTVIGKQSRYAKQKRSKSSSFVPDDDDNGDDGEDDDYGAYDNTLQPQQLQPQQSQSQQGQHKQRSQPPRRTAPAAAITAQGTLTSSGDRNSGLGLGADGPRGSYSDEVLRSLQLVDPSIVNYELIEALLVHIIHVQQQEGPAGLLKGWTNAPAGALAAAAAGAGGGSMGAVLIFMPGAPEIDRLVRQLQTSSKVLAAAGKGLRVLPLHGGLPPSVQSRVFDRPPKGVLKVVVATNVAETSLTIDDVTVVIDTGRHKEMSYDTSRGLSCLLETWVSQAAAQQRRGRAGRVAPGTCYRLWPSRMWQRLAPHQPPEVLRVPLQQLCLTTKAALVAASEGFAVPALAEALRCLLTPPSLDSVNEAVTQLIRLGALDTTPDEVLSPLGTHLAAMPMDAALGKALLYGCMLRCASPLLTIAAALGHGRPLWLSPPPDKRAEVNAARQALAPQVRRDPSNMQWILTCPSNSLAQPHANI
eukprot:GHUV01012535.1.p1 GENE.GHUV01012535.1~~GHUV01012535.1.p1  ORF type:complete len:538 (+),score=178.81 GHUV01012535.1:448-2061(+)